MNKEERAPQTLRATMPTDQQRAVVPSHDSDEMSPVQIANVLLKHRHLVGGLTMGAAALAVLVTSLMPSTYTASASFMPQVRESAASRLSGLAAQLGIGVSTREVGQSPQFYGDLLVSRQILGQAVLEPFGFWVPEGRDDSARVDGVLADLLKIDEDKAPRLRRAAAIAWLRDEAVVVSVDRETGVVGLEVSTQYAPLSEQIAERLIELVNAFNLETRQSQAAQERRFVEARVSDASTNLRAAEDELKNFLQNNRVFDAPDLRFEHDRLQREVAMRQQLYSSLVQAYEEARIAEVRNTPVVTVIDPSERPVSADSKRLPLLIALSLVLGAVGGAFISFVLEYLQNSQESGEEEIRQFQRLWRDTKNDVFAVARRLRLRTSPRSRSQQ